MEKPSTANLNHKHKKESASESGVTKCRKHYNNYTPPSKFALQCSWTLGLPTAEVERNLLGDLAQDFGVGYDVRYGALVTMAQGTESKPASKTR